MWDQNTNKFLYWHEHLPIQAKLKAEFSYWITNNKILNKTENENKQNFIIVVSVIKKIFKTIVLMAV